MQGTGRGNHLRRTDLQLIPNNDRTADGCPVILWATFAFISTFRLFARCFSHYNTTFPRAWNFSFFGAISYLLDIRERPLFFANMVMRSAKHLENSMTVRMGYAHRRSAPRPSPTRARQDGRYAADSDRGRNGIGENGKNQASKSIYVQSANNHHKTRRNPYGTATRQTANRVRRFMRIFIISRDLMRNGEMQSPLLRAGHHGRRFCSIWHHQNLSPVSVPVPRSG